MNIHSIPAAQIGGKRGWSPLLASVLATVLVAACGGGGGASSAGGAGSVFSGPITGFGSVIVNGVRINDDTASVTDDDGNEYRGKLKLGQYATVKSERSGTSYTASSLVVHSELQGPISGTPDATSKTFVVLGQTVEVTGSTYFDSSLPNGFASLTAGTVLEIHGAVNTASNKVAATYIEKKTNPSEYKIQGKVTNLDSAAMTFNIGTLRINYSTTPADKVSVTPAENAVLRVKLRAETPEPTVWTATRIRAPEYKHDDRDEAEIEGTITAFTSSSVFSVNGVPVDAANALFQYGTTGVVLGARVEVEGRIVNGTLVASKVELEDEKRIDELEFEIHGTVSVLSGNSFKVAIRSGAPIDVTFDPSTVQFIGGSLANLANGAKVEVKGQASSGSSSTTISVKTIKFES